MIIAGQLVSPSGVRPGQVRFAGATIDAVGPALGKPDYQFADECLIFAGMGDIHIHARDDVSQAESYKEDFCTAARAAINGGVFMSDDRRLLQSLAGALGVVLENVRFREREQHLRWLASRAELKALRAQINPHFLFNALSVIAGLVHYQPELADETIEQLAQVFRYTLRKSENEWAPLADEVEFVSAYLRVEQARFGERLRFQCDVDPRAARLLIPAMCIQPLIENAIKHGVSGMEGRGAVGLRAGVQDGVLLIEVSDNGPGFPPGFSLEGPGDGVGLRNVAERLRGYYGETARLSWESGLSGTRVVLTLPQSRDDRDPRLDS